MIRYIQMLFFSSLMMFFAGLTTMEVEKIETAKTKCAADWEQLKNEGPLAKLDFQEIEREDDCTIYGWLSVTVQEGNIKFDDAIYVKIKVYKNGYSISFIDKDSKNKLPDGLYYWKSTENLRSSIISPIYEYKEYDWYKKGSYDKFLQGLIEKPIRFYPKRPHEKFAVIPSLLNEIGLYMIFLKYLEPRQIVVNQNIIQWFAKWLEEDNQKAATMAHTGIYANMNEEEKKELLSIIPLEYRDAMKIWLYDAMDKAHISKNQQELLADQFIGEFIFRNLFNPINRALWKKYDINDLFISFNIYEIFEEISQLKPCPADMRINFIKAFAEQPIDRQKGSTAGSIIECVGGVFEWD